VVERQLDRILHVLADDARGPGQRGDEADLQLLLRHGRRASERAGGERRERGRAEWDGHQFLLLRKYSSNKNLGQAV
jgi:hypothetical protein